MSQEYSRTLRIGEQIHRDLAQLLREEVKDPRVGMVTITEVEVSRDLSHAKVFFTLLGNGDVKETGKALNHAAGFLRRLLGRQLHLRVIPELRFIYDDTGEKGARIDALLAKLHRQDTGHDDPDD
ncbi:MAG: 30S ribosome-binding factor RbfA [Gammaproteobacteria bacterium]|jgi:ribosome-binding factor A